MSVTVSNCFSICRSPSNTSNSKMLYSFSKAERFKRIKDNSCDKFYEIDSNIRITRATGLGYAKKYDFTKDSPNSPPPNSYSITTDFDNSKIKKRGYYFGEGRSEMQVTGPLSEMISNKNPGPGAYQIPSSVMKTSYSLRAKFDYENKEPLRVPGPGTYSISTHFSRSGKNPLSKYKNASAVQFSKSANRFDYPINKSPGPGSYDISKTDTSETGEYFFSKIHNSKARRFGRANRQTLSAKTLTPGPGQYTLPSDFGQYMSKEAVFSQQTKNSRIMPSEKENILAQ